MFGSKRFSTISSFKLVFLQIELLQGAGCQRQYKKKNSIIMLLSRAKQSKNNEDFFLIENGWKLMRQHVKTLNIFIFVEHPFIFCFTLKLRQHHHNSKNSSEIIFNWNFYVEANDERESKQMRWANKRWRVTFVSLATTEKWYPFWCVFFGAKHINMHINYVQVCKNLHMATLAAALVRYEYNTHTPI